MVAQLIDIEPFLKCHCLIKAQNLPKFFFVRYFVFVYSWIKWWNSQISSNRTAKLVKSLKNNVIRNLSLEVFDCVYLFFIEIHAWPEKNQNIFQFNSLNNFLSLLSRCTFLINIYFVKWLVLYLESNFILKWSISFWNM